MIKEICDSKIKIILIKYFVNIFIIYFIYYKYRFKYFIANRINILSSIECIELYFLYCIRIVDLFRYLFIWIIKLLENYFL